MSFLQSKILAMFYKIDAYLMARFQKLSDVIADWFGVDCFWVAHKSTLLYLVLMTAPIVIFFIVNDLLLIFMLNFITILESLRAFHNIKKYEKITGEAECFKNPAELELCGERSGRVRYTILLFAIGIYFVAQITKLKQEPIVIVFYIVLACYFLGQLLYLFIGYFYSCTPKRPKKTKLKKLGEKITELFTPKPSFAGA